MRPFRVGVQFPQQHSSIGDLERAWSCAEELGVDSLWLWDHFVPAYGDPNGAHFESWTLLAALARQTTRAHVGVLATCAVFRNPDLVADMARTVDHLAGGRLYLALGAGWFEREYREYGYEFGTPADRVTTLGLALSRIKTRLARLVPAPLGALPILVAGGGERVTLRLVAEHADAWNTFGPVDNFSRKSTVLDQWCERLGRDPADIERTVLLAGSEDVDNLDAYAQAGATHFILGIDAPFDLGPARSLVDAARDLSS